MVDFRNFLGTFVRGTLQEIGTNLAPQIPSIITPGAATPGIFGGVGSGIPGLDDLARDIINQATNNPPPPMPPDPPMNGNGTGMGGGGGGISEMQVVQVLNELEKKHVADKCKKKKSVRRRDLGNCKANNRALNRVKAMHDYHKNSLCKIESMISKPAPRRRTKKVSCR